VSATLVLLSVVSIVPSGWTPSAAEARTPVDVVRRQTQIREVLATFDPALSGDALSMGPRGRRDLVLFSSRGRDGLVLALKQAYREERSLVHGFRVAGWANIVPTGSFTFTLKDESEGSWVIELADAGVGCRVTIWGIGRVFLPERRPLAVLPMRLIAP